MDTSTASYLSKDACEEFCNTSCFGNEIYGVITILALTSITFGITAIIFYKLYRREQELRSTMWQVNSEDIRPDKMQLTSETPKFSGYIIDATDEKSLMEHKRIKNCYTTTVVYKGTMVAVQKYRASRQSLEKRNFLNDLDQIFLINYEHICKFYGSSQEGGFITVLTEYCTRGSLQDLLKENSDWDDVFKNSLIFDIVKGMRHLHQTSIGSHGNLKPSNCLIDSRFMVKITDFGIIGQRSKIKNYAEADSGTCLCQDKLWIAPEFLRIAIPPQQGTKKGDVYSFAIIAQEILYQRGVFYRKDDCYTHEEILEKLTAPVENKREVFRPTLQDDDDVVISEQWRITLKKCWAENPKDRLDFQDIFKVAAGMQAENTLIDSLLQRLQKYSDFLEEKVEEKTEQYKAEKERSDSLLYQMLPKTVANRLKLNTDVMPESYEQVTVYFSDIVGFSAICHQSGPLEVVQMLNDLYTMFDQIIDEFDVYKVETIGDAYMVVSGLPIRNGDNHAREIARMAIRLRDSVCNQFEIKHIPNLQMKLRIGIHTGPVVAGVVGLKMPRYCLFGDTVNTAARMEQNGKELKIHISPQTKDVLDAFGTFQVKKRRQSVTLKGLGEWNTWWLSGEKDLNYSEANTNFLTSALEEVNEDGKTPLLVRSLSSATNHSWEEAVSNESAMEGNNGDLALKRKQMRTKRRRSSSTHSNSFKRKGSYPTAPSRYRPSCHANPSKERRNGSAITPLLVMSQHDSSVVNDVLFTEYANGRRRSSQRRTSIKHL